MEQCLHGIYVPRTLRLHLPTFTERLLPMHTHLPNGTGSYAACPSATPEIVVFFFFVWLADKYSVQITHMCTLRKHEGNTGCCGSLSDNRRYSPTKVDESSSLSSMEVKARATKACEFGYSRFCAEEPGMSRGAWTSLCHDSSMIRRFVKGNNR